MRWMFLLALTAGACAGAAPVKRHAGLPRPIATPVCTAVSRPGVAVYAAPRGTSVGTGTIDAPWDLRTALACAGEGDTVWLRGGVYSGLFATVLRGTASAPIVFRQYPGERATIDGTLRADGAYLVFWGFEIMQSMPETYGLQANTNFGRFINLVVHDAGNQGISFWTPGEDAELYGCIVYNNGTHENLDHGVYVHNVIGTKHITDNVFFDNFARGIQVYASHNNELVRDVRIEGNISFNNGSISDRVGARQNLVVNAQVPIFGMVAVDNLLYYSPGEDGVQIRVGNVDPSNNRDIVVDGNYGVGGASGLEMRLQWTRATVQHNTFVGGPTTVMVSTGGNDAGYQWAGNTYYRDSAASAWRHNDADFDFPAWRSATGLGRSDQVVAGAPTATKVVVRPNRYEEGRAFIVVYNFAQQRAVDVGLSGVLKQGSRFTIRNVQDVFAEPVVSGTYDGGTVSIPMNGVEPPVPLGRPTRQAPKTGPAFDVFLVTSTRSDRAR
jgi:parallel beta-helix repeat protein